MIVERIRNLNITKRPIFTGLYGCTFSQEYFVEDNLCKYNSWQELYRYLRGEGYTTVFYNEHTNFFSYEESQLETLFFKKPEEIAQEVESSSGSGSSSNAQGRYVSQFASPNGHNRRRGIRLTNGDNRVPNDTTGGNNSTEQTPFRDQTSTAVVSHNPGIIAINNEVDHYFQLQSREGLNRIFRFMDVNPGHKLAIVFTMPTKVSFGQQEPRLLTDLQERFSKQKHAGSGLRLIVLYDYKEVTQLYEEFQGGNAFFNDNWIKNQLFPDHQEGRSDLHKPSPALFHVCSMGKDEVANMLNRRRILEGLQHTFAPIPFDDLCARICQQFIVVDPETEEETSVETVAEFMDLDIPDVERTILRMEQEKASNKLKRMLGIDKLIEQFEKYLNAYRRSKNTKKKDKEKFRPHMAFMGNPGTGKTTVARLFADKLREEGLLSRGQFVEVEPADLIAEHIGGTRIKTQAVCDRARGGVLFVDEAYGLMSGANDNGNADFGKEAIEVLIRFMENEDNSLVIFAGYPDETKQLIDEGNPGFRSRFNDNGFFYFEDYEPDVLYQIAKKNIPEEIETTPVFDKALHDIVVLKHAYRTKNFGNARDMENLANTIVAAYYDAEATGPLDIKHLPNKLRVLVDPSMLKEDIMLAELNDTIVGQENIKKIVKDLYVRCLADRTKMSNIEGYTPELQRLNYIFAGNPGTGKTTIARIIGNLLQKMGVLSSNDDTVLTEVSGGDVANMSPAQIQDLFEDNIGKVLFIDEAYQLRDSSQAIAEIVQNATNKDYQNKLCLILAGYTTEMHQMMRLNPGMFSRFEEVIFHDYTNKELWEILKRKINAPGSKYLIDDTCKKTAINYFSQLPRGLNFGNARIIDVTLIPYLTLKQGERYIAATEEQMNDPEFAKRIFPEDFPTIIDPPVEDLTPMEQLNRMLGMEKIREQFQRYREAFKRYREGKGGKKFRPHMAFMGNPGTGKTTVARLFGEILHEDGLLPQGHFVEATVGDLIGQYVGETRGKARDLCDRASGGVLFIDEAYGLMSGANTHGNINYGNEAIEVLIQFMENNRDSIVIVAGYPEETKRLINDGNPGFKSRFNEGLGFFYFEDYKPDVLYKIARSNILKSVESTTEAFDKALSNIVVLKHAYRTKVFGNARDMENLANTITSAYYDAKANGPLDVVHLPERLRILVDPNMLTESAMLAELNDNIIGQENIKSIVRNLFNDCLTERTKMTEIKGYKPKLQRLNYIFAGNPGTGKTTIARIIGNLLQKMGVLSSNDTSVLTEIGGDKVAHMTPDQIQQIFEDNIGKVLFIDEAYLLAHNRQAIGEIVQNATNTDYQNKMCIILAGYTTDMHEMMRLNPGMESRFTEVLFHDYTNEELWEIMQRKVNAHDSQLLMDKEECEHVALKYFASLKRGLNFGNARIINEILLPQIKQKQNARYANATPEQKRDPNFANRILPEDFPATIGGYNPLPPKEELEKMLGIANIREQFQRYCEAFKRYRKGKGGKKFRPHMAFMGNPGTGKTTVARLFGAILHEDGLLPQGQFVEATVGDLVGQYIGETRVKAGALCDRAKGGVLFIDEAYGLMSGAGVHGADYGKEAIEVLIQFMENNDDSLVILAGYPNEINNLINNGNSGFRSRFNDSFGFFYFEDYEPDVLYKIARAKILESVDTTTAAFDNALRNIIVLKHAYRTKIFGNARDMENLANTIVSAYQDANDPNPLDVTHLPERLRLLVDSSMLDEQNMLAELNDQIVGQEDIKTIVGNLYNKCKSERDKMSRIEGYQPELQTLNYLFIGNPGTGKTTVARIIGNLLQKMGVLSSNDNSVLTEISGGDMTHMRPAQIEQLFQENIGKVLFIDEAYQLGDNPQVIQEIVQKLTSTDYQKKMCIILAGYNKEMNEMLRHNSGMESRFEKVIFQDYTNEELWEILKRKVNAPDSQCMMDETACEHFAIKYFASQPRGSRFGNARIIELTLLPFLKNNRDRRYNQASEEEKNNPVFAKMILPEDFPQETATSRMSDEEVLRELNNLVGLEKVKKTIEGLINMVKAQDQRSRTRNTNESKISLNFVFRGNPGTGKTTVARLLGNILANYGLIVYPEVVTYTKADLVDKYVGSGPQNVQKMFEDSIGKVLFIDEAYELADASSKETLDALTNMITDKRFKNQLAIVLAGYHGEMSELLNRNTGLHSRFPHKIDFDNYSDEELTEIFYRKLTSEGFVANDDALVHARMHFSSLPRNKNFGNAREAENLLATVKVNQGNRVNSLTNPTQEELFAFLPEDFPNYGRINVDACKPQQGVAPTPMDKLNRLSGMDAVRKQFVKYLRLFHYCKEHPQDEISQGFRPHMAFMGNPGTGKTTVARLFGEILREEGLLTSNNFVEVGPDELVGEYVGQSAPKARRQFERARGGILFIDEAYELYKKGKEGGGNQFGQEVVTALIKFMEDERDTIVIMAGYTDELRHLIKYGNSGLESRVTNEFVFEDYQPDILFEILLKKLGSHETTEQFKDDMRQIIQYEFTHRDEKRWGNARAMENHANAIFGNYLALHNAEGPIDSDCIPDNLRQYLPLISAPQGNSTSTTTASQPTALSASLNIDLTKNPPKRKVTNKRRLREQATGLLSSSNGEGTGFIISIPDRYILTCCHVVEEAVPDILFRMNCNREFETMAHVLWQDFEQDMALLQLDEIPDDACYVQIDSDIDHNPDPSDPEERTKLLLCSYPRGSKVAKTPSISDGKISNYEKQRQWNERCFDTILTSINATHGCSGGPVVRESDFMLVGLLQGGMDGSNLQFITDIHQLFRHKNLAIKCKKTRNNKKHKQNGKQCK